MTKSQVIEALKQYRICGAKAKAIEQDIKRLRQLAVSSGSSIGDGMPHGSGSKEAKYTRIIEKIADLEQAQILEIESTLDNREAVEHMISSVKNTRQRDVLKFRYIYGWSMRKIAANFDKTEQNIYAIHNRAINQIVEATKKAGE